MPDLRAIGNALAADPLVATPPLDVVEARGQRFLARRRRQRLLTIAAIPVIAFAAFGTQRGQVGELVRFTDTPAATTTTTTTTPSGQDANRPTEAPGAGAKGSARPGAGGPTSGGPEPTAKPAPAARPPGPGGATANPCPATSNAGATDVGVTGTSVTINVHGGDDSAAGVRAVVDRVNAEGGVCGRRIRIETTGPDVPFVQQPSPYPPEGEYFALVTGAHDPAFRSALSTGRVDQAAIPVIGTEGLYRVEYTSKWTFPVGSSMASQTRIMTMDAYERGARRLAIVFETGDEFERSAKPAFDDLVRELPGAGVAVAVALDPGADTYGQQIQAFNATCQNQCDFALVALSPTTATKWFKGGGMRPSWLPMGALSTLSAPDFGSSCGMACDGLVVWSPFVLDASVSPSRARGVAAGDVLVAALRSVGSNLTRERLRDALNSDEFTTSVTPPLRWGPFANVSARSYRVKYKGGYNGVDDVGGWRQDPRSARLPA